MNWPNGTLIITWDTGAQEHFNNISYRQAVQFTKDNIRQIETPTYTPDTITIEV